MAQAGWRGWVLVIWLVAAAAMLGWKWAAIHGFALSDTDDNMRMSQVRAWLNGQAWFDLRQHRLDPLHGGANIHWSRLVDLPIAGIVLAVKPFFGGAIAERAAAALAPLLPLGLALGAAGFTVRRLVAPAAYPLACAILLCAPTAILMYMPLRIDHHGWQLALLLLSVAAVADGERVRGGVVLGLSGALSLAIGLEMMPYIALLAGLTTLRWVANGDEAPRLATYGASLAAGAGLGYAAFASWDNRGLTCDVLSPVWLSVALAGGGLLVALSFVRARSCWIRAACGVAVAALVAGGFALAWPECLGRPERVSPEVARLWLSHVREAKPLYSHGWRTAWPMLGLPIAGLAGVGLALWRARGTERFGPWAVLTLLMLAAFGLLLWQTRAAPAAQLLAVPGATALGWAIVEALLPLRSRIMQALGAAAGFLFVSGLAFGLVVDAIPEAPANAFSKRVRTANYKCPTLAALAPIARLPKATILTFIDFGPRLITVTHHDAIAGPYHRNGPAILDIQHSFRSPDPEVAHAVMRRHGASLLLICPGMSESTIYAAEAKKGFYVQLMKGKIPPWLAPVPLPKGSPFRLWRLVPGA